MQVRRVGGRRCQGPDADIPLYTTLVRFDQLELLFGPLDDLAQVADYPRLWAYARELHQSPAFAQTTNFDHLAASRPGLGSEWARAAEVAWTAPHDSRLSA